MRRKGFFGTVALACALLAPAVAAGADTVRHPAGRRSAARACAPYEVCDGAVSGLELCLGACELPRRFDWRSRHGQDWNTPVRDQGEVPACSAFGPVAAIETAINLYFARHLDVDLSEEALFACSDDIYRVSGTVATAKAPDCLGVGSPGIVGCLARDVGLLEEECYPYISELSETTFTCDGLCPDWDLRTWRVTDFWQLLPDTYRWPEGSEGAARNHQLPSGEAAIKRAIITHGPVAVDYGGEAKSLVRGHVVSIVGWQTGDFAWSRTCPSDEYPMDGRCGASCETGRTYCINSEQERDDRVITIAATVPCRDEVLDLLHPLHCDENELCDDGHCLPADLVTGELPFFDGQRYGYAVRTPDEGWTYWIYKNSWGKDAGDQGYATGRADLDRLAVSFVETPIIPPLGDSYQVWCGDADGDGYCWWGIGTRPADCPEDCARLPDWDDGDPKVGPLGHQE